MPNVSDLTDVAIDLPSLQSTAKPSVVPPVVSTWWKVLYFNTSAQRWAHAVLYSLMVVRRRLVSSTVVLQSNIGSLLQWGEIFSVDGAETVYFARSNPTTTAGAYDGNVSVIKVAGPGAFVSRDSMQIVTAKKTISGDTVIGKNLAVVGEFKPIGGTIDCGRYTGAAAPIVPPSNIFAQTSAPYTVQVSWLRATGPDIKAYVVEVGELAAYAGSSSLTSYNATLPTEGDCESVVPQWYPVAAFPGGTTSATIDGLRPGFLYVFRVAAISTRGIKAYNNNTAAGPYTYIHPVSEPAPRFRIFGSRLGLWQSSTLDPNAAPPAFISTYKDCAPAALVLAYSA